MEIEGQNLTDKINQLIAIAEDARTGYEDAAKLATDSTLKKIFSSLAVERDGYIDQLTRQLRNYGGQLQTVEQPTARTWINLHSAIASGDKKSIIIECIKGETLAIEEYETVLDNIKSDSSLSQLLVRQRNGINSALNGIKVYLGR